MHQNLINSKEVALDAFVFIHWVVSQHVCPGPHIKAWKWVQCRTTCLLFFYSFPLTSFYLDFVSDFLKLHNILIYQKLFIQVIFFFQLFLTELILDLVVACRSSGRGSFIHSFLDFITSNEFFM